MLHGATEAESILELAVQAGSIAPDEANQWRAKLQGVPAEDSTAEWLVSRGALDAGQAAELQLALRDSIAREAADTLPASAGRATPVKERVPEIPGFDRLAELGRGGMGVVYKAWQQRPPRWVALKVMIQGVYASAQARQRFTREVAVAAQLNHPGFVPVYEADEHDGMPYYTMELVEGEPLHVYLQLHEPGLREKLLLFSQICDVVAHAHENGLVHRDLKPSNIMVDRERRVRVLDFGLAKLLAPSKELGDIQLTQAGAVVGTYLYMSPEQARGAPEEVDEQSDVFSLGLILYEMLTSRLPYPAYVRAPHEVLLFILREDMDPPSKFESTLRGDLDIIVAACLERDKARRYRNAADLRDDIQRHLRIEPIRARPSSLPTRAAKYVRRNKVKVASAVVIAMLAALGVLAFFAMPVVSAWTQVRSDDAVVRRTAWSSLLQRTPWLASVAAQRTLARETVAEKKLDALDALAAAGPVTGDKQKLGLLEGLLSEEAETVRVRAAALLADNGPWQRTLALTSHPLEPDVVCVLVSALAEQSSEEITTRLAGMLSSPDADIGAAAGNALTRRVETGLVSAEQLGEWLNAREQPVELRLFAADAARRSTPEPDLLKGLWAAIMDDRDGYVRSAAADSLASLMAASQGQANRQVSLRLTDLREALAKWRNDPGVAKRIVALFSYCDDPGKEEVILDVLQGVLKEPWPLLWRDMATEAVRQVAYGGGLVSKQQKAVLLDVLVLPHAGLKSAVLRALARMEIQSRDREEIASIIGPLLMHDNGEVRAAALEVARKLAAPELVGYLIEATTSRSAALAEPAASLLEDLHVLFVDRYPEAARQAREALIAKGVLVAVPASFPERALRLLLPHEWRSKEEILSSWGPVKRPEVLRKVGQFLSRDQPDAVRRGAARWLDELTDGQIRVDPKDVDLDELTRVLAGPWTWDEGRETFTLPSM